MGLKTTAIYTGLKNAIPANQLPGAMIFIQLMFLNVLLSRFSEGLVCADSYHQGREKGEMFQ